MTKPQIIQMLKTAQAGQGLKLNHVVRVGESDAIAGELLEWLFERLGEDATHGEVYDVLESAQWWITLLDSLEPRPPTS